MENIEELKEIEIEKLTDEISDIAEIEKLILDGANTKIPYSINYPIYDVENKQISFKQMSIKLQPVNSADWNNAMANFKDNNRAIKIVEKSLYTKDEQKFPMKLIQKMPSGVITTLYKEIAKISGVELNSEEDKELIKDLMGF